MENSLLLSIRRIARLCLCLLDNAIFAPSVKTFLI